VRGASVDQGGEGGLGGASARAWRRGPAQSTVTVPTWLNVV
jgi:hypothetical protein